MFNMPEVPADQPAQNVAETEPTKSKQRSTRCSSRHYPNGKCRSS
jgi:hypothetical protein